ncbi:S-layer homology domain-containing protein [Paenibacillus sp. GCM10027626]|uniref:S-layer homology domain-containing protein n=1 Tax=Paenibacillus sp. GCM10027626 TaxID=3273411 RepID=UPI003631D29E
MRKKLSFMLSICLLFSTIGSVLGIAGAVNAADEGENRIENGKFEAGKNGWEDWGNTEIVADPLNGQGGNAVKIGTGEGGMGYYINAAPGESYVISGWGRSEAEDTPAILAVKSLGGQGNGSPKSINYTNTDYEYKSVSYTVPEGATELLVYVYKNEGSGGSAYLADIRAVRQQAQQQQVHNHAYLPEEWIFQSQTDQFIAAKVNEMKAYAIEYQFNNIGTLRDDGTIDREQITDFGHWIKVSRETDPNQKIIAWINGNTTLHAHTTPEKRKTIVASLKAMVEEGFQYEGVFYKVDGIQFDIEPLRAVWKDDPELLALMKDIRAAVGPEVHLSMATPAFEIVWSDAYISQMAEVMDMLNPMIYDTQGPDSWKPYVTQTGEEYEQLWKNTALRYSAAIAASGNPDCQYAPIIPAYDKKGYWDDEEDKYIVYHEPFIENVYHAARGLKQAMGEGANVYGSGIFWWELFISDTPDPRDNQDYSHARGWWLTEWVNQGESDDLPQPLPAISDKTALRQAVNDAEALYAAAEEGSRPGQYKGEAKALLKSAIEKAKAIIDAAGKQQAEVDAAIEALKNAVAAFKASVNPETDGYYWPIITPAAEDGKKTDELIADTRLVDSENGRKVVQVTLNGAVLKKRLEGLNDDPKGSITLDAIGHKQLSEAENGVIVELPLSALRQASADYPEGSLSLRTAWLACELRLGTLDMGKIARELEADLEDVMLHIVMEKSPEQMKQEMKKELDRWGASLLTDPVQFHMMAVAGEKSAELSDSGLALKRTLAVNDLSDAASAAVVRYNEAAHKIAFSSADVRQSGSVTWFEIKRNGTGGNYAVMRSSRTFADLGDVQWAKDSIERLASKLIVSGTGDTSFAPRAVISRAEFAALLMRGLGIEESGETNRFTDVTPGKWYSGIVSAAVQAGLIGGYADGSFRPGDGITREEMAVMSANALAYAGYAFPSGLTGNGVLSGFSDYSEISEEMRVSFSQTVEAGLILGTSGNKLQPGRVVTRAEASVLLLRLLQTAGLLQ